MIAEPSATAPVPAKRASIHCQPRGQLTRESTSTDSSRPIGQTAAPTCAATAGDQPGGRSAAGSQVCSTLAATDIPEPKTKPAQATNRPPTAEGLATDGVAMSTGSPPLV